MNLTSRLSPEITKKIIGLLRTAVLVLSVLLIVFISVDTFNRTPFLSNPHYMRFQFWVCVVFLSDFFIELWFARDKRRYTRNHLLFLLLSVPWLDIASHIHAELTENELYWVRFIPLARGALAMSIVVGYISSSRISSLLASYVTILAASVYFGSLIFMDRELGINPAVDGYGTSLYWACMTATTIGCDIQPMTVAGKIVAAVLSCMGVLIFPLFTVYVTALVRRYRLRTGSTDN